MAVRSDGLQVAQLTSRLIADRRSQNDCCDRRSFNCRRGGVSRA